MFSTGDLTFVHASGLLVTARGLCKPGWMDLSWRTSAPYSPVRRRSFAMDGTGQWAGGCGLDALPSSGWTVTRCMVL